jgi:hypothetical protein
MILLFRPHRSKLSMHQVASLSDLRKLTEGGIVGGVSGGG